MCVSVVRVSVFALALFACGAAVAQQPNVVYYAHPNANYPSVPVVNQQPDRPLLRAVGAVAQAIEQNNQINQVELQRRQMFAQQEIQRSAAQIQAIQVRNQLLAQQARIQQLANQPFAGVQQAGYYRPVGQPIGHQVGHPIHQPMAHPNVQPAFNPGPQFTPDYRLAGNVIQAMSGVDVNQKQRELKRSWDSAREAVGGVPTPPLFKQIAGKFGW
jgi:hypothetical protein